jgi:hypothetical protein
MRRLLVGVACAAIVGLSSPSGLAAPAVVVVEVSAGPLDADRVRASVGKELGMLAVAPGDPRASAATGRLAIEARRDAGTLTVSYTSADAAHAKVTRTVSLPAAQAPAEASAVFLAGNLGRDDVGDVLASMKRAAKTAGAPPEPTREQARALAVLKEQASVYERGAEEYRDTIASIVKLRYETKKKELLSGLDREIVIEKAELERARRNAITKLERFIATHQGERAGTDLPDAMYRLAALYEERARAEDASAPLEVGLKDAIALYKRVVREHPSYREIAGIHYFLGHALNDAGRVPEAQQVWRSLVCQNHFAYPAPADPRDPEREVVKPVPQDARVYTEVYPKDCAPLAQSALRTGEEPKYVAEVWWQIGNWEFDQLDTGAGAFGYNRAASAYSRGLAFHKAPLFGVTLYKYAWTLFKQQRYELATAAFVQLLLHTDDQEKKTGDRGLDFRSEAYTYIAGSLANVDFKGPAEGEPLAPRLDILDTEPNVEKAEAKLHVAIDRAKDSAIVPQDKPWTAEIHRALADEFRSMGQLGNAIELYEAIIARWPMDPKAPAAMNAIAEACDQKSALAKPGAAERDVAAKKALEARTKLSSYAGKTPWVDANRDDPGALHDAERLVRAGLRRAAVEHTNNGRAALAVAKGTKDPRRLLEPLARAAEEYDLAARGWQGYLALPAHLVPDAYESSYWNADARRSRVRIAVHLHELAPKTYAAPSKDEIDGALAAARRVRDSNEDDTYLDAAALFVVDLSDVERDLAYARYRETGGAEGVPLRDAVKFDGPDPSTRRPLEDAVPRVVEASMDARDEYARVVPPGRDPERHALDHAYYVAETTFLYGQWERARERFESMWKEHCGVDAYGFKAWEKLVTMAALQRDEGRTVALMDAVDPKKGGKSCSAEREAPYTTRVRLEIVYARARAKFEETCEGKIGLACKNAGAPGKKAMWREVAALYEKAFDAGPNRDEAAEGAMNAAYAYTKIGEHRKAIGLYERFIAAHPATEPVAVLVQAHEALAAAYFASFDYLDAATTYAKIAATDAFAEPNRRSAARNAATLYAGIGDKREMLAAYSTLERLRAERPGEADDAEADYAVASFDYKRWSPAGTERDRREASAALVRYYQKNRKNPRALRFVVEAAYAVAKMKRAAGEPEGRAWLGNTAAAWEDLDAKSHAEAQLAPYVDEAAEASFLLLDEDIAAKFDAPAKRPYPGTSEEVFRTYARVAGDATKWDLRLENEIIRKYASREWVAAAYARRGAIFDALRSGLYDTTKPKLFDARGEQLLATLRRSGQQALIDRADALEDAAKELWRTKKKKELDGADEVMVRRYATAAAYARAYDVKSPHADRAVARLGYFTGLLGDATMRAFITATVDPTGKGKLSYADGMYQRARPGSPSPAVPTAEPTPLPVPP